MELDELVLEENDLLSQKGKLSTQLVDLDSVLKENEVNKEHAENTVRDLMAKTVELKGKKDSLMDAITKLVLIIVSILSVFWLFFIVLYSCLESSIGSFEHRLLIVVCIKLQVFKILYNVGIF